MIYFQVDLNIASLRNLQKKTTEYSLWYDAFFSFVF